jgi:hypothetical protein
MLSPSATKALLVFVGRQDFLIPRAGDQLGRSLLTLCPFMPAWVGPPSVADGSTVSGEIQAPELFGP